MGIGNGKERRDWGCRWSERKWLRERERERERDGRESNDLSFEWVR